MNDSSSSRRRNGRVKAVGIAAAAALVAFGAYKFLGNRGEKAEFIFASVQMGDIEDLVTATGTLEPRDKVDVGAQVSGQIERILVEVGDTVTAGQVLAEIDATQARARVDANRASLRAQESNLVDRYNTLEKAERDFERQKNLLEADATTREAYLNAETTLKSARQGIESLKLQIEQQKASMRVEEANLQYTTIKAPIDGTVVSIAAKQGQTINATQSAPTLLTIADLATMTVRTDVSEADIGKLTDGMQAYFTTLGSQNRRYYGTLKRKEPTPKVQNSVVLYNALFDVQNDSLELMPSMTAQVFFVRADARNVLVVPMAAVQQGQQIARELALKEAANNLAGQEGAPRPEAGATQGAAGASAAPTAPGAAEAANNAPPAGPEGAPGRRGQGGPGAGGPPGGFGGNMTPEQREEMRRRFAENGGPGGAGGFRGGMGGMGFGGGMAANNGQPRRGVVVVKGADGKLEPRNVMLGVSNRTHAQVLEGLQEGDEVVVGRVETEAAPAAATPANNQPNNQFRPGGGGFGGGGRPF